MMQEVRSQEKESEILHKPHQEKLEGSDEMSGVFLNPSYIPLPHLPIGLGSSVYMLKPFQRS